MLSSEGPSVQDLARRFTQLNAKWTEITNIIFEKYRIVQDASHQYGEFKGTVVNHCVMSLRSNNLSPLMHSTFIVQLWLPKKWIG